MSKDIRDLPELVGDNPGERLLSLFTQLGWDMEAMLDPSKIRVNYDEWEELSSQEMKTYGENNDDRMSIGFLWVNYGPGADRDVPTGKVVLLPGWVS